jgi:hypothetical protein
MVLMGLFTHAIGMVWQAPQHVALVQQSGIIFEGTVSKIGATSFADVPRSEQTIVVRVDTVIKKPAAVLLKQHDLVTVEVKDLADLREGIRATFYTDGWIFGSGIAVKELGHEITPAGSTTGASGNIAGEQIQGQISDAQLQERLGSSDAVVVGRVMEVHPWTAPKLAPTPLHISEHDPDWQEAVVQIESAIKGAESGQKLVVRFPGSLDVAWVDAHKFKKGEQGTFLLKKDQLTGIPKALMSGIQVDAYTALKREDVLSKGDAVRVRSLLQK